MIRVLQFADVINRHDFIDTIVEYADRKRFEVSVCVRSEENNIACTEYGPDVKYRYLPGNSRRDAIRTAWRLSRMLMEWQIDILHAHHFEQAFVGWLATRFYPRTKLVIGRHYSDAIYRNQNQLKRKGLLMIEQRINRDAARIFVPSQMIFEILTERQGIDPKKVDIVHYGFVPEKYVRPKEVEVAAVRKEFGMEGRFVVANFSRYHEEKGHRYLIEAAAMLRDKMRELLVICVGEGGERENLERQISGLGLEKTVVLAGWRRDAMTIMAASDVVVQSTLQEAFSQVMCEAMWMEKPLVMTDVSGASDIIENNVNGIIVPKAEPNAIVEAVLRLSRDEDLRSVIIENARQMIENRFSIVSMIKKYESSFEKALLE